MELIDAFDTAFKEWDRLVHEVGERQWEDPTPCSEWNVRELVNHLVGEHLWAPHLLNGETLAEVGDRFDGDVVGDAPVAMWEQAGSASRSAFHRKGALRGSVHVTGGKTPATEFGWQMTTDLAVHGWDLAQGIGVRSRMPDELADAVYEHVAPQAESWHESGIFDPPVPVPDDAVPQDRLVALLGRRP
ncbi:TIGR03086 family metal-binding protein [Streptomyces sp. WMMB 322]|uniref:TIGR03086 family metal-binding protein n=1 Tax=Streptomyces sp. WMMB 322 TaxID=1286821 RepID=UPI0006E39808|nr:TIGR03086 family metal-binding protein [Streptomyces sp. WMMB 322]SCK06965.1 TIGR03086 family protein [Streptomyces sp. WMMB 322]